MINDIRIIIIVIPFYYYRIKILNNDIIDR